MYIIPTCDPITTRVWRFFEGGFSSVRILLYNAGTLSPCVRSGVKKPGEAGELSFQKKNSLPIVYTRDDAGVRVTERFVNCWEKRYNIINNIIMYCIGYILYAYTITSTTADTRPKKPDARFLWSLYRISRSEIYPPAACITYYNDNDIMRVVYSCSVYINSIYCI